jgi:hypothetical protein
MGRFLALDRASAMTATLANITCRAFPGRAGHAEKASLNDRAHP